MQEGFGWKFEYKYLSDYYNNKYDDNGRPNYTLKNVKKIIN